MHFSATTVKTSFLSPLGPVTVAATDKGLAGVWFNGQRHLPDFAPWPLAPTHPVLVETVAQLQAYFAGTRLDFDLPLDLHSGTTFQQAVWHALLTIAPGSTTSYGALSAAIGKPKAVRALGAAVGRNPISIIVPCHRVLGGDGSLTGYAGGLERKLALLKLEGVKSATPAAQGILYAARPTTRLTPSGPSAPSASSAPSTPMTESLF